MSTITVYAPGAVVEVITGTPPVFLNFEQPTFTGDFETGVVTGAGNKNWKFVQRVAVDRYSVLSTGARQGTKCARVEVRSGDQPINPGSGQERAECLFMQDAGSTNLPENLNSGIIQYTLSVKFDPTWTPITGIGAWGIFTSLHGPDVLATNPAWSFSATDKIRLNMRVGDITQSTFPTPYDLSNGALAVGKWIDFILTVKYASDNAGWIRLARRDEGQASYANVLTVLNTPTLLYSSAVNGGAVGDHYIKHGLYRNAKSFTSILYLDGFTRAKVIA